MRESGICAPMRADLALAHASGEVLEISGAHIAFGVLWEVTGAPSLGRSLSASCGDGPQRVRSLSWLGAR